MRQAYYIKELTKLRKLAKGFAAQHPNLAPLLAEDSTNPDIERLLEGFAYLSAQLQEKLDDEFPELVHALAAVFFPSYLRPIPSNVVVQFLPQPMVGQPIEVQQHAELFSQPIDEVKCLFRTVAPLMVQPLELQSCSFVPSERGNYALKLDFLSLGLLLNRWSSDTMEFYLEGNFLQAKNLFFILMRCCNKIGIKADDASEFFMPQEALVPRQFRNSAWYDPSMQVDMPSRRVLRQFLTFPQQFLCLQLTQLLQWTERGQGKKFSLYFYFDALPKWFDVTLAPTIAINTMIAVNLFPQVARPINFDEMHYEYLVTPDDLDSKNEPIYAVQHVEGFISPMKTESYLSFSTAFNQLQDLNTYQLHYRYSDTSDEVMWYLSVLPLNSKISNENTQFKPSVRVDLLCCNGHRVEAIVPGLLNQPSNSVPSNVRYTNLHTATRYYPMRMHDGTLWRFISLLSYNLFAEPDLIIVKELLLLEANFMPGIDRKLVENYVHGITELHVERADRLYMGRVIVGYDVHLDCDLHRFDSPGDLFLFCSVLEIFFAHQVPLNTYVKLLVKINQTGEVWKWKARTSDKLLE